jgi:hypothetical protein
MTALQSISSPLYLIPAYGRTYMCKEDMLQAWEDGRDFRVVGAGYYTSVRDIEELRKNSSSVTLTEPRFAFSITL